LRPSIQNGIRQQPNQPPTKKIPVQTNHGTKPAFFSTRVTIGWWQFGHIHCIGISPYSNDCVVMSTWVAIGGPCGGKSVAGLVYMFIGGGTVANAGYTPGGGTCDCKTLGSVEYVPRKGGIGGACG